MRSIPNEFEGKMDLVRRIMDRELTPLQRETVDNYYLRDMTFAQIAAQRGVCTSTTHRCLHRAMDTIRRFLLLDEDECEELVNSARKQRGRPCKHGKK